VRHGLGRFEFALRGRSGFSDLQESVEGIPASVLEFRAVKPEERCQHVLFVDGSARFVKGKNQNTMSDADGDAILAAYQTGADPDGDGGVNVRLVPFDEIKANGFDLNIGRYLKTAVTDETDLPTAIVAYEEAREARKTSEATLFARLAAAGIADLADGDGDE